MELPLRLAGKPGVPTGRDRLARRQGRIAFRRELSLNTLVRTVDNISYRIYYNYIIPMKTVNRRRTPASNNRAHADVDHCLKRKLQNPQFRAAYNAEDTRIELVLQIIKLRQERGMTQADLAKAIGTRQANVSRLERFDANLTLDTLEKVALALGANLRIDLEPVAP